MVKDARREYMRTPERWDIFCRVVDNFGDAAVCWRLARELTREHAARVRLWIDDLESLRRLVPAFASYALQTVEDVEVHRWEAEFEIERLGDVVVEAFGCHLPDAYVAAMASASAAPLWIVLEYLTAESWVPAHHGLPSPHPRLPLERYFFFPGFVKGTGGLLRENDLFERRDAFEQSGGRDRFWSSLGQPLPAGEATVVSLFAYAGAPVRDLFEVWERGPPIVAAIPQTALQPAVLAHFGMSGMPPGHALRRGALEARIIPFVPQIRYDELLWSCDCNFVRGEDSFVRAQWAARPLVWHIYPQEDEAHGVKLESFLELYCAGLGASARGAAMDMMRSWNQAGPDAVSVGSAWRSFMACAAELRAHTRRWADDVAAIGSLAANLARFCAEKLK